MATFTPTHARYALIGLRGALGAGWLAPERLSKTFGLGTPEEPTLPYLVRLFTVRDAALAFLSGATKGDAQRLVLKVGVVVDGFDTVAGILAGVGKKSPALAAVLATITAASAAGLGIYALQD